MIIGYNIDNEPVTADNLHAGGALTALLENVLEPNLVRTLEHTPAFVHSGPFANIAHGYNSVLTARLALRLNDYAVAEASFGASPGAEKFIDIKCRMTGLHPDYAVVVATVCALKHHGGVDKAELNTPDIETLKKGLPNPLRHVENMTRVFGPPTVVAINRFPFDPEEELSCIVDECKELGVDIVLSEIWAKGDEDSETLARKVMRFCEDKADNHSRFAYEDSDNLEEEFSKIMHEMYRDDGVVLMAKAEKQTKRLEELGFGHYPVCMAKAQFGFSGNKNLTGTPRDFKIMVREVKISAGMGFVVVKVGDIMTMSGLSKIPAAEHIDVGENGEVIGLF